MATSSFLLLKFRVYEIPGQEDTALFEGFTQTRSLLTLGGLTMGRLAARGTVAVP